jgi:hypothetical protein
MAERVVIKIEAGDNRQTDKGNTQRHRKISRPIFAWTVFEPGVAPGQNLFRRINFQVEDSLCRESGSQTRRTRTSGGGASGRSLWNASHHQTRTETGEKWTYTSSNTAVLGGIVARVSGRNSLPDVISELIWSKIGAEHDAILTVNMSQ